METPSNISILNYPVKTVEAEKLWSSEHKSNTAKAVAAFSTSVENYNQLLKRRGITRAWRTKCVVQYSEFIREPDCVNVPFSDLEEVWWDETLGLPYSSIEDNYSLNSLIEAQGLLYDSKVLPPGYE
jgi:hypothetical protein